MNISLHLIIAPLAVATFLMGAANQAGAATLFGQIAMRGKATLDAPLATATRFSSFENARVGFGTHQFATPTVIPMNQAVSMTPFSFTPSPATPVTLWNFSAGGHTYAFELVQFTYERFTFAGNDFLNLSGRGFATIDGVHTTPADFCFSTQQCAGLPDTTVTWSAEMTAPSAAVPEAGATILFLVCGLISLAIIQRAVQCGPVDQVTSRPG